MFENDINIIIITKPLTERVVRIMVSFKVRASLLLGLGLGLSLSIALIIYRQTG